MATDSIASIIANKIQALGKGTIGSTVFIAVEPDSPANCMVVFDSGDDQEPQKYADRTLAPFEYAGIQIIFRNTDYLTMMTACRTIIDALTTAVPWTDDDVKVAGVFLKTRFYLGRDERGLYRASVNFRVPNQKT
jgi:hypothetical protein